MSTPVTHPLKEPKKATVSIKQGGGKVPSGQSKGRKPGKKVPSRGVVIARENRERCNSILDSEGDALMVLGLSMIYGTSKTPARAHRA